MAWAISTSATLKKCHGRHLVQQAPDWFEITCEKVKKEEYGKLVVRKILQASPDQGSAGLTKLRPWMREVRQLAQPVLGLNCIESLVLVFRVSGLG